MVRLYAETADRPRERLRQIGARGLAVRELLALLVGSGGAGQGVDDIARRILDRADGDLRRLARLPPGELERVAGVGAAVAGRIVAAFELGRRAASAPREGEDRVRGPGDVHRRLGARLRDLAQEEFHAVLLNAQHRPLRTVFITRGILDASLIHPREVFRPAIAEGAAAIILVHNHPSGDPTPSAEDRAVTRQLARAGRTLGIPVLDHVVIGDGCYRALAEDGALE